MLNSRNTFYIMISYVLSAFGYEFIFFVMTIYVYQINKSALNVGIFAALTLLPRLLGVAKVLIGAGVLGMFAIGFLHLTYNADQAKEPNIPEDTRIELALNNF